MKWIQIKSNKSDKEVRDLIKDRLGVERQVWKLIIDGSEYIMIEDKDDGVTEEEIRRLVEGNE